MIVLDSKPSLNPLLTVLLLQVPFSSYREDCLAHPIPLQHVESQPPLPEGHCLMRWTKTGWSGKNGWRQVIVKTPTIGRNTITVFYQWIQVFYIFMQRRHQPHKNGLHCRNQNCLVFYHNPDGVRLFSKIHLTPTFFLLDCIFKNVNFTFVRTMITPELLMKIFAQKLEMKTTLIFLLIDFLALMQSPDWLACWMLQRKFDFVSFCTLREPWFMFLLLFGWIW